MKRFKTKALAWVLSLVIMVGMLPVMSTTAAAAEINTPLDFTSMATTDKLTSDGYKWDAENSILTLDGANINIPSDVEAEAAITVPSGTTIHTVSDSSVTNNYTDESGDFLCQGIRCPDGSLNFTGTGTLTVNAIGEQNQNVGVCLVNGSVTIAEEANLVVNAGPISATYGGYSIGIMAGYGKTIVVNGTLTATAQLGENQQSCVSAAVYPKLQAPGTVKVGTSEADASTTTTYQTAKDFPWNGSAIYLHVGPAPAPKFDARNGEAVDKNNYSTYTEATEWAITDNVTATFAGWWTGKDGTGTELTSTPVGGTTYYAKWITESGKTVVTQPVTSYGATPPADSGITLDKSTTPYQLTLDNAVIWVPDTETTAPGAISMSGQTAITFSGNCVLVNNGKNTSNYYGDLISAGINISNSNLTIEQGTADSVLTVVAAGQETKTYGIKTATSLSIKSGTVNAKAVPTSGNSGVGIGVGYGLSNATLYIGTADSTAKVTAIGGTSGSEDYGVYAYGGSDRSGTVEVKEGSELTASGHCALLAFNAANKLLINGGTLKVGNDAASATTVDAGTYNNENYLYLNVSFGPVLTVTAPTGVTYTPTDTPNNQNFTVTAERFEPALTSVTLNFKQGDTIKKTVENFAVGTAAAVDLAGLDAGDYTVEATSGDVIGTAALTIAKADHEGMTASANLNSDSGSTVEVTLPALPAGASYGEVSNSNGTLFTVGSIAGGKVTVTAATIPADTTAKTFTVPVTGATNYNNYTITVTVTPVYKTVTTISGVSVADKTYDGTAVSYTGTPSAESGSETLTYTYQWQKEDGSILAEAPKDAGSYKLVVSGSSENYTGKQEITFTIAKAPVTVAAKDMVAYVDDEAPTLPSPVTSDDYTVTGLIGQDTLGALSDVTITYASAPVMSAAGEVALHITGTTTESGNYAITYADTGKLVIKIPVTALLTLNNDGSTDATVNSTTYTEPVSIREGNSVTVDVGTKTGYVFKNWTAQGLTLTAEQSTATAVTFSMPATPVTLTANWEKVYSISGKVHNNADTPVGGATVKLMKGSTEIARTTTDNTDTEAKGTFTLSNVLPGTYNLVITNGDDTTTIPVTVTKDDVTLDEIKMSPTGVSSKLEVNATGSTESNEMAAGTVISGLKEEAEAVNQDNPGAATVSVDMNVTAKTTESVDAAAKTAIKEIASTQKEKLEFLDITVTKTINGGAETPMKNTSTVLEIITPYDMTGKYNITVYRQHVPETGDSESKAFGKLSSKPASGARMDGTFWLDTTNNLIYIYAKKFSTYAVGYDTTAPVTPSSGGSGGGSSSTTYPPTIKDAKGGDVTVIPKDPAKGDKVTIKPEPDKGYEVEDVTVTNNNGNSVKVTDNGNGTYSFTQPAGEVTVTVNFKRTSTVADPTETGVADWLITDDHIAYLNGYSNGNFGPTDDMTRAQVAQMFYNLLKNKEVSSNADFSDIPNGAWYEKAANTLAALGVMSGVGDNKFEPNRSTTRAEFTVVAMRFAKLDASGENFLTDMNENQWFYEQVKGAIKYGWISGYSDGTFRPYAPITRAEVATIVNRMLARSADEEYVDNHTAALRQFSDVAKTYWAYYNICEATNAHDYTKSDSSESWTATK